MKKSKNYPKLTEEEAEKMIEIIESKKIKRKELMHLIGLETSVSLSKWKKTKQFPASCRAFLAYWELMKKLEKFKEEV